MSAVSSTLGGVLLGYLGGDGEVGGARGVLGLEVVGAFAGPYLDEPERPRFFAGGFDDGDGDLRPLDPAL